jgi:hypothetical protein
MPRAGSQPRQRSITAAAARITLGDKKATITIRRPLDWQDESFAYCSTVPELKHAQRYVGDAFAKVRIFAAYRDSDSDSKEPIEIDSDESPVPPEIQQAAIAEVSRLQSELGGQSAILRRAGMNLDSVGEGYLVGFAEIANNPGEPPTPEEWRWCSIREVKKKGDKFYVLAGPSDKQGREITEQDTIIRIWEQDAEWANVADCAMKGVLGEAKILQILSQQVLAQAMRAMSNGFFTLPNELSFGPADETEPEEGEEQDADPFEEAMEAVFMGPIEDPSDPNSVQPGLLRGPAEFLKEEFLRHVTFWSKDVDEALDAKIEARVKRIARGISLPVEVVMGLDQTTYANAKQVDQDTFEDYLQPRVELLCDGLTIGFLRPNLRDSTVDEAWISKVVIWYDASVLIGQPNTETHALEASKAGLIGDSSARQALGFSDQDAPTPLELLIRLALNRGVNSPEVAVAILAQIADEAGVTLPSTEDLAKASSRPPNVAATVEAALREALLAAHLDSLQPRVATPIAITASSRERTNPGTRLVAIDREIRTRLIVATNDAMTRALERAGNKMKSKANGERAILRNVHPLQVGAMLGPTKATRFVSTEEALEGAWDELERQFMAWGQSAQADALNAASVVASGFSTAERSMLQLRQAEDLSEAWAWLKGALQSMAAQQMFDPTVPMPENGEFDPALRVPAGLLREAVARAGGARGLISTRDGGAYITLRDSGHGPAGGIGTGELLSSAMRDHGVATEGYEWTYGPAYRARPFEPHMALDGLQFVNFDDPILANTSGFPETAFYIPGDHAGCICDVTPILIPAQESEVVAPAEGAA